MSSFPAYEVPIERGKIREFARATMSRSDEYRAADAVIPPTFLTTARLCWEPRDQNPFDALAFDRRRVLHGGEEYRFHGSPPRAGEFLTATARVVEEYERKGKRGGVMRFGVVLTEFRDGTGRLRAEQRSTIIETAQVPGGEAT